MKILINIYQTIGLGVTYLTGFTRGQSPIPIDFDFFHTQQVDALFSSILSHPERKLNQRHIHSLRLGNDLIKEPHDYKNDNLNHFARKWETLTSHELKYHDRFGTSHKVNYGGSHPFETLERRRKLANRNGFQLEEEEDRILRADPWKEGADYKPIRISLDTKHLDLISTEYSEKKDFLKSKILPKAREFWTSALHVFPMVGNLKVDGEFCPYSDISQTNHGLPATDLLILVAANVKALCDNGPLAAARSCQADQYDRPIVGSLVVCLDKMNLDDENIEETYVTMLIHELAHILGMRSVDFAYYYDANTGLPRTSRPFKSQRTTCVDGIASDIVVPSTNTMRQGRTAKGSIYYEIVTPAVRSVVRNQFNCQSMSGARLENQPTNNGNCFGTHWEARLFTYDLLSAITTQTKQVLSPLTLALLEDSGWYKPDYSVSEISPFGHGRGCNFVYDDCIDQNGVVPEWGKGFFCNDLLGPNSKVQCDGSRRYIARCDLIDYTDFPNAIPPNDNDQYFNKNPTWGGLLHTAGYCPLPAMVVTGTNADGIFEFDCEDPDLKSTVVPEYFGENSKCFETNLARPICMKIHCDANSHKVNVLVDKTVIVCEKDGDWLRIPDLAGEALFECPPIAVVCPDLICPQNCSGRGICDYTKINPSCKCCDSSDTSPTCDYSPVGCESDSRDDEGSYPVFPEPAYIPTTAIPTTKAASWPSNSPPSFQQNPSSYDYPQHSPIDHSPSDSNLGPPALSPINTLLQQNKPTFYPTVHFQDNGGEFPDNNEEFSDNGGEFPDIAPSIPSGEFSDPAPIPGQPLSFSTNNPTKKAFQTPTNSYPSFNGGFNTPANTPLQVPQNNPSVNGGFNIPSQSFPLFSPNGSVEEENDDLFNIVDDYAYRVPTARPSPLPRSYTKVVYSFCLDHGILVPISEVLSKTSQSIRNTLTELIEDDVQVMENEWDIDENHLRVANVDSIWVQNPPPQLECSCGGGDSESTCSAIETTVRVSHWDQLDGDQVRYVLLYFSQYLVSGLSFKAKYFGYQAATATVTFTLYGLATTEMSKKTKKIFEQSVKDVFNEQLSSTDINGLHILDVAVKKIIPIISTRLLMVEMRGLEGDFVASITSTVTAEYIPPPYVDLKQILQDFIEEGSPDIAEKLKSSGDLFFKDLGGISNYESVAPTMSPTNINDVHAKEDENGEGSKIGMILGIIVGLLAAGAALVAGYVYLKKENGIDTNFNPLNDFDPQKPFYDIDPSDARTAVTTAFSKNGSLRTIEEASQSMYDLDTYDEDSDRKDFRESTRSLTSVHFGSRINDVDSQVTEPSFYKKQIRSTSSSSYLSKMGNLTSNRSYLGMSGRNSFQDNKSFRSMNSLSRDRMFSSGRSSFDMSRSTGRSFQDSRSLRSMSTRSEAFDSYVSGPSQNYTHVSTEDGDSYIDEGESYTDEGESYTDEGESYTDDGTSYVNSASKISYVTESNSQGYENLSYSNDFKQSRLGDPPQSNSSDMENQSAMDPPEETIHARDDYEDQDQGTFAGRSISAYTRDDISSLPSVLGVEDIWFEEETVTEVFTMATVEEESEDENDNQLSTVDETIDENNSNTIATRNEIDDGVKTMGTSNEIYEDDRCTMTTSNENDEDSFLTGSKNRNKSANSNSNSMEENNEYEEDDDESNVSRNIVSINTEETNSTNSSENVEIAGMSDALVLIESKNEASNMNSNHDSLNSFESALIPFNQTSNDNNEKSISTTSASSNPRPETARDFFQSTDNSKSTDHILSRIPDTHSNEVQEASLVQPDNLGVTKIHPIKNAEKKHEYIGASVKANNIVGISSDTIVLRGKETSMRSKQETKPLVHQKSDSVGSMEYALKKNESLSSTSGCENISADDETQIITNESILMPSRRNSITSGGEKSSFDRMTQETILMSNDQSESFKDRKQDGKKSNIIEDKKLGNFLREEQAIKTTVFEEYNESDESLELDELLKSGDEYDYISSRNQNDCDDSSVHENTRSVMSVD